MLPRVTIEGRVVADPELRFAPSGTAVCKFRIVSNDRRKNRDTGEWEDGDTLWMPVTCFKQLAENATESLDKGDLVVVTGKIRTDEWTTEQNEKRSMVTMVADTVSVSLQFRTIQHGSGKAERSSAPNSDDPWAGSSPSSDEPPF